MNSTDSKFFKRLMEPLESPLPPPLEDTLMKIPEQLAASKVLIPEWVLFIFSWLPWIWISLGVYLARPVWVPYLVELSTMFNVLTQGFILELSLAGLALVLFTTTNSMCHLDRMSWKKG